MSLLCTMAPRVFLISLLHIYVLYILTFNMVTICVHHVLYFFPVSLVYVWRKIRSRPYLLWMRNKEPHTYILWHTRTHVTPSTAHRMSELLVDLLLLVTFFVLVVVTSFIMQCLFRRGRRRVPNGYFSAPHFIHNVSAQEKNYV